MSDEPKSFLERGAPNPFFGGFQGSNIVEATVVKVHTDEANNATFTVDVITIKNEMKSRVPILYPYANAAGTAGIRAIPNVTDKCVVALGAGNVAYVIGFHSSVQLVQGRGSASNLTSGLNGNGAAALKGTFGRTDLIPGAVEMCSPGGNRVLVHPGGSIAIDAKQELFTFYDAVKDTMTSLARSSELFTAGGSMCWKEGKEKAKRSMAFEAQLFTKSATDENLKAGPLRGGARMRVVFSEVANHFFLEITDEDGVVSRIAIGPNGIIMTSSDGVNQGSISVAPDGSFNFIAGDPAGLHTQLDLSPEAIAISAFSASTLLATLQANVSGRVAISSQTETLIDSTSKVTIQAPNVNTQGGITNLSALGGLGVATKFSTVKVFTDHGPRPGFIDNLVSATVRAPGPVI